MSNFASSILLALIIGGVFLEPLAGAGGWASGLLLFLLALIVLFGYFMDKIKK